MIVLVLVLVAVVLVFSRWAVFTTRRLHRLQIRVDSALLQLQGALDRRAALIAVLDPALATVAAAATARNLRVTDLEPRLLAEQQLLAQVSACMAVLPAELVEANTRVQLAQRFYNAAVADTRALRLRPGVKLCQLGLKLFRRGGMAALPDFGDFPA